MRTVIFLGLLSIACAINENWLKDEYSRFFAIITLASMFMDFVDFFRKTPK